MTKSKHSTASLLLATGAVLFLIPSLAMAQPPAGGKGKNARANGERGAQRGPVDNPDEMAAKMFTDHDKNRDAELEVEELTAALAAQRQQRGGQRSARPNQQRASGPGQPDKGNGRRDAQRDGKQQRPGGSRGKQGAGQGSKRGQAQGGQRGTAGRGTDPAQIAAKLMAEFDKNGSDGLDVQELVASIKSQRQNHSGRGSAEAESGKGGRGQTEGERRSRKGDSAEAGQGSGQGRQRKGKAKPEKNTTEPGTGVVPKRPGE